MDFLRESATKKNTVGSGKSFDLSTWTESTGEKCFHCFVRF